MKPLNPGQSFETTALFPSGLLGTIGVALSDNQGTDTIPRSTVGIIEQARTGGLSLYSKTLAAPLVAGEYTPFWDAGSTPAADEGILVASTLLVPVAPPSIGYAAVDDVKARAGRLAVVWNAGSTPSDGNIADFISEVSSEVDAYLGARGFTVPLIAGSAVALALRGLVADGALALALAATFPEEDGPASSELAVDVRTRYTAGLEQLALGKHAAVLLLEGSSVAPSVSSFWRTAPNTDGVLDPVFRRGQVF